MKRWRLAALGLGLAVLGFAGCGQAPDAPPAHEASGVLEAPPAGAETAGEAGAEAETPASRAPVGVVRIVDLDGVPLQQMAAIATATPNAFEEPLARGVLSGPDGESRLRLPGRDKVYVRAWDPLLRYFANNYYEVAPDPGVGVYEMTVTMVPGAILEGEFYLPEGDPAAHRPISLMLVHPSEGPWWPADSETDASGHVRFEYVPAGEFDIFLRVDERYVHEASGVPLRAGGRHDLGAVLLH